MTEGTLPFGRGSESHELQYRLTYAQSEIWIGCRNQNFLPERSECKETDNFLGSSSGSSL
jgi:hypothetical protein